MLERWWKRTKGSVWRSCDRKGLECRMLFRSQLNRRARLSSSTSQFTWSVKGKSDGGARGEGRGDVRNLGVSPVSPSMSHNFLTLASRAASSISSTAARYSLVASSLASSGKKSRLMIRSSEDAYSSS